MRDEESITLRNFLHLEIARHEITWFFENSIREHGFLHTHFVEEGGEGGISSKHETQKCMNCVDLFVKFWKSWQKFVNKFLFFFFKKTCILIIMYAAMTPLASRLTRRSYSGVPGDSCIGQMIVYPPSTNSSHYTTPSPPQHSQSQGDDRRYIEKKLYFVCSEKPRITISSKCTILFETICVEGWFAPENWVFNFCDKADFE